MPSKVEATKELIWQVEQELGITDRDEATRIADWVAQHTENEGAARAAMFFDDEGCGPYCSWCGGMWGICVHGSDSDWYKRADDCATCRHAKDGHDGEGGKCQGGDSTGTGYFTRCKCAAYAAPTPTE